MTAVVGASLGVLGAADRHSAGAAPGLAALQHTLAEVPAAAEPTPAGPAPVPAAMPAPEPLAKMARDFHPRTVRPVAGVLTSGFGMRWGELHAGIDFGEALGTPIAAVTDGVVVEAGPASGFGLWVRVQQDDGTIGVYGHVNDILATVGQQVRAGDIIATVGNRGFSTGPHLHYEVWAGEGGEKLDPLPWLEGRGIPVGQPQD
ncbi:M23 family metallopeptidase [Nocardia terpenica]|uniref:M23 family metallopeptidase n=1 Tax=Nocardia terpenica TaxID=455432 RepID=UPI0018947B52|nr:M23 family metallopeptidase [Nocardia terpenica]MBF6061079.1 M23 family metallopeptidase [Nocardia terpenica]MBF6105692.1 M23 family metallopeptidase [Nocardia terpenica]MBF6112838.1 M23 family metallopeptidase [Nocardia terpenica]MBF6118968.1 M23 family metallopeptidase [Nocardia terpenica]